MIRSLLTVIAIGLITIAPLHADTTWVNIGAVSGTWTIGGSPYMIYQGDVMVASSGTLTIEAGVKVEFTGHYKFHIEGLLQALGTIGNPITFTCDTTANPDRWGGIRFYQCDDSTKLEYCIVECGSATGTVPDYQGGGLFFNDASPIIRNCTIRWNLAMFGGGIACYSLSEPLIASCDIYGNQAEHGGGAFAYQSQAQFNDCFIYDNIANNRGGAIHCQMAEPEIMECVIQNNAAREGGGISCYAASPTITDCQFFENVSTSNGGGMECMNTSYPVITGCSFVGNVAMGHASSGGAVFFLQNSDAEFEDCEFYSNIADFGGAIYASGSAPGFERCVFLGNSAETYGGALYVSLAGPDFRRCTFFNNYADSLGGQMYLNDYTGDLNSSIISHGSEGCGLFLRNSTYSYIRYNDFYGNVGENLVFYQENHIHGPAGLGFMTHTNANGDPCDVHRNIMLDPEYVNPSSNDVHLLASSPCIDAGDPAIPDDPDGTVADMGAYYFDQLPVEMEPVASIPKQYRLLPCYPNPFNATTVVPFEISSPGMVNLSVYNLLGQKINTILQQNMAVGTYTASWDADFATSGTYFVRLEVNGYEEIRTVVLQK